MKLGILIVSVIVVLGGAGYLVSGSARPTVTIENPISTDSEGEGTREAESDRHAADDSQLATDTLDQGVGVNSQQSADNDQQESQSAIPNLQSAIKITDRLVSFGYEVPKTPRTIDTIILHSSYNNQGGDEYSVDKVIAIWKSYSVAPHYLIDRKGTIHRLVEDKNIAWHAGVSEVPDGRTDVNKFSVGIEILNALDDKYTDAQYEAINDLVAYLKGKYKIRYILGHDDIAPGRKTDPWNFDWERLE